MKKCNLLAHSVPKSPNDMMRAQKISNVNCVRIFQWEILLHIFLITSVPPSPYSLYERGIFRILFDFMPEITDMHHYGIVCAVVVRLVPHGLIEALRGKNLPPVFYEQQEDCIFCVREGERRAVKPHFLAADVNLQAVVYQRLAGACAVSRGVSSPGLEIHVFSFVNLVSADQCLTAADQLIVGEWLCQIVIPSAGKSQCLVAVF